MSDWKVRKRRGDYNALSELYNDDVRIFCQAPTSFKEPFQSVVNHHFVTATATVSASAPASLTISRPFAYYLLSALDYVLNVDAQNTVYKCFLQLI